MIISIHDKRVIQDIQDEFTSQFPYLKLEFFTRPHKVSIVSPKSQKRNSTTLGDCRTVNKKGNLEIVGEMTSRELEQQFRELYGLNVQLFRKSGSSWLETSVTDSWTLQKQNDQGETLTKIFNKTVS